MSERTTIHNLLEAARGRIERLTPEAAHRAMADGARPVIGGFEAWASAGLSVEAGR